MPDFCPVFPVFLALATLETTQIHCAALPFARPSMQPEKHLPSSASQRRRNRRVQRIHQRRQQLEMLDQQSAQNPSSAPTPPAASCSVPTACA